MSHPSSDKAVAVEGQKPHVVSMFNPHDYNSAAMQCDLTMLTVVQMKAHAAKNFSLTPMSFDLIHNGHMLDDGARAIDAGIGNGAVVVVQPKLSPAPLPQQAPVGMLMQGVPINVPMYHAHLPYSHHLPAHYTPMQVQQMPSPAPLPVTPAVHPPAFVSVDVVPSRSGSGCSFSSGGRSEVDTSPEALCADFCTLAVTSEGSASLLNSLRHLPDATETVEQLLPLICPRFLSLATNHHASKVMIGIVNVAHTKQVRTLLEVACEAIVSLCECTSGAELLVAMVGTTGKADAFRKDGVPLMVSSIAECISGVGTSVNGRKVLQTVLQKFGADAAPIYEAALAHLQCLCTDQCGCITVQRLLDYAEGDAGKVLAQKLYECVPHLLMDPYGNYVVQHALKADPNASTQVAAMMRGNLLQYAVNKFSSNVIEQCLQTGTDDVKTSLITEVCEPDTLRHLMQDAYGNYVVQSAVDHAMPHLLETLRAAVAPLISHSPYGYRIETKLQRRLKKGKVVRKTEAKDAVSSMRREPLGKLSNTPRVTVPRASPQLMMMMVHPAPVNSVGGVAAVHAAGLANP